MDDDTVQTDSTSAGEESKEAAPEKVVEPTMAETVQTAVDKAVLGMESRMKQSARDTARFEVTKTKPEEGGAIRQALKGWDGSDGRTIEQVLDEADKNAQLKTYQDRDVETKRQQEQIDQGKLLYDNFLRSMKIDPADPEIDWARDESDVPRAIDRFNTSVAKKIAARDKPVEKAKTDDTDFVDTAVSAGVEGDAGFVERMVSGELEMSKENVARFDKIRTK